MNHAVGTAAPAGQSAPVILCVDDEPNILSALRRLFRAQGYQVRIAEGGAAALQVLENEAIDLVISDMRMPVMDGAQFLQQVRTHWPDTVRLLLTGYADVQSIIDAINRGEIYRYITKPWDEHDMVLQVRHALERKALEAEKHRLELLAQRQNEELRALNASLEQRVVQRTAELGAAHDDLLQANAHLKAGYVTTLKVFSTLIEMRGGQLAGHSRRVAELAQRMAVRIGLDAQQVQEVFVAALLHEIGKLGFSDALLATPVALMNSKLLGEYRQHAVRGEQLLMPLQDLRAAAACVGAQLERFDGTGFPKQLFEQAIPQGARILAVASDYDNLQLGVLTERKLSAGEAKTTIQNGRQKRYDPRAVDAFVAVMQGVANEKPDQALITEMSVDASALAPGMVLARDLIAPSGLLMLSAGHAFDARLIQKVRDFERSNRLTVTAFVLREPESAA